MKTLPAQVVALLICVTTAATITAQEKQPDLNVAAAISATEILKEAAWLDLFNGKDLSGWTGDTAGYVVEEGILICKKGGKELATEKEYGDFALNFEVRL